MRFIFIFLIALLKFGTLKTEPIDYNRKNGQINVMFPSEPNKPEDTKLNSVDNDWTNNELKFQPNESTMRKIINIEENEEFGNEVFGKIIFTILFYKFTVFFLLKLFVLFMGVQM